MKKSKNIFELVFMLIFIAQIVIILINNLTMMEKNLDSDAARLLNHIILMAKEKTLLIPDWSYPTTLELDCTSLFALPIYMVSGNIYLSASVSNILLLLLFASVIIYLFDKQSLIYPLFSLDLILIPYTSGTLDYYNMMFYAGSQYIIKIMLPILFVSLILHIREKSGIITYVFHIIFFSLLFLTSLSSGWYVMACGLFPIMAVYFLYKFFRKEKTTRCEILLFSLTVILGFAGAKLNIRLCNALGNDMLLRTSYGLWDYWGRCFVGIFELFGGVTSEWTIRALSAEGIRILSKLGLTILYLISIPISIQKFRKENHNLFFLLFVSIPIWNFFVLCTINAHYGSATFEYRYHLLGMIPVICIFSTLFVDFSSKTDHWQQNILYTSAALGVLYLTISCFRPLFVRSDYVSDLKPVISYCQEMNPEMIYFLNDNPAAEICRLLDGSEKRRYLGINEDGITISRDYYACYESSQMQTEHFLLVVDYDSYPWNEINDFNGMTLERIMLIGNRGIYAITD